MTTQSLPTSFTLLIGPPRSGTTLIANAFMSHPKVSGVMEPYQRRRQTTIGSTDVDAFLAENQNDLADMARRPDLAMKETTTRLANVEMSLDLMRGFATRGIYTGLIIILRCPFAAFLSQVEASSEMWAERKLTEATGATFNRWINAQREALRHLAYHARAQHLRLISYEAFCANPGSELARLMALVPVDAHPDQLKFAPPKTMVRGGDPKTVAKSGHISVSDRDADIQTFMEEVKMVDNFRFAIALRAMVLNDVCVDPDQVVIDRLTRLLILGA